MRTLISCTVPNPMVSFWPRMPSFSLTFPHKWKSISLSFFLSPYLLPTPLSLLLLSYQSASLDESLTTFLSKLLFSVLSRSLKLLSTLSRLLISFLPHIPHTAVPDHHHLQAQWLTPPLSLAADSFAACCSALRAPRQVSCIYWSFRSLL